MASQSNNNDQMDRYWRTRNFKTSARLHLQHWLFQSTIGFTLSPPVLSKLRNGEKYRIADLGCGNGAWLFDVARLLPDAELYGFDIQPVHFPAKQNIPPNVQLIHRDVLAQELLGELAESFDIVHIRAFGSMIKNSDCSPILKTVKTLLKPGGYLQWEEADSSAMKAEGADGRSAGSCSALLNIILEGGKATGTTFDWFDNAEKQIEAAGFGEAKKESFALLPEQYKAWTEDYLLVYEEVAMMVPSEKDVPAAPLTREKYQALFDQVVKETEAGAVMHSQHLIVMVGKKG